MNRPLHALTVAAAVLLMSGIALAGRTGSSAPERIHLPDDRPLHPAGVLTPVGNFPTGGALTADGRFYWSVSTGRGLNDIRIVSTSTHKVVQVVPIPGASGGIVIDSKHSLAYVSGVADSSHLDQQRLKLQGRAGDVVHVFRYDAGSGRASFVRVIAVPPPVGSPVPQGIAYVPGYEGPPQNFPPTNTTRLSWPDRLAVSKDGATLLVPLNLADHAAIVNTATGAVKYVAVGHYPYAAAILADGKTGLVTNETTGTVSVIDLAAATVTKTITVGANLSSSSAIFVVEDDAQDGADHVDAHRIPALVISPYTKPGAVVSRHYDQLSAIRSMELILGMHPLGLFDALATPMYDAFSSTPLNTAPYSALVPQQPLNQLNTAASPDAGLSAGLDWSRPDAVDERTLDAILWKSVHGASSTPPKPGPHASRDD